MRLPLITACIVVAATIGSCDKEETPETIACFNVNEELSGTAGFEFSFTNCSENASSYHWDFGDGETSTDQNPKHVFDEYGSYNVKLRAEGESGAKESEITVKYGYYTVADFEYEVLTDVDPTSYGCSSSEYHIAVRSQSTKVCIASPVYHPSASDNCNAVWTKPPMGMRPAMSVSAYLYCPPSSPIGDVRWDEIRFINETSIDLNESLEYPDMIFTGPRNERLRVSLSFELWVEES